jgi:hypothetical protein
MDVRRVLSVGVALAASASLLAATTGCVAVRRVEREDRTERVSLDLDGADEVKVDIDIGAGRLAIGGGATGVDALMDAEFDFSLESWEPDVDYRVRDGVGDLTVRQPDRAQIGPFGGDYRYEWDIEFADDVPLYLNVGMGAGESHLDLSDTDLRELDLSFGAGDTTVDLTGDYGHDVDVSIDGGAGAMTLYLPSDLGVRVDIDQGIGEVVANGFRIDGDDYTNDAYDEADVFIDVTIDAGVGQITLVLE